MKKVRSKTSKKCAGLLTRQILPIFTYLDICCMVGRYLFTTCSLTLGARHDLSP